MENVELSFFYELGGHIAALRQVAAGPRVSRWEPRVVAQAHISLEGAARSKALPVVAEAARHLLFWLADLFGRSPWAEPTIEVPSEADLSRLVEELDSFEDVVLSQLKGLHIYRVNERGLLNHAALIDTPEQAFAGRWEYLPRVAQEDWRAGCRCLAFDLPTASGFHVLRCIESLALSYLDRLNAPRPEKRDLYNYLELLRQNGASPQKIEAAQKIRALYRNPLMHPEVTLTQTEAADLLTLCMAMIRALLEDMQARGLLGAQVGI